MTEMCKALACVPHIIMIRKEHNVEGTKDTSNYTPIPSNCSTSEILDILANVLGESFSAVATSVFSEYANVTAEKSKLPTFLFIDPIRKQVVLLHAYNDDTVVRVTIVDYSDVTDPTLCNFSSFVNYKYSKSYMNLILRELLHLSCVLPDIYHGSRINEYIARLYHDMMADRNNKSLV